VQVAVPGQPGEAQLAVDVTERHRGCRARGRSRGRHVLGRDGVFVGGVDVEYLPSVLDSDQGGRAVRSGEAVEPLDE
jgi:hypothetical protein